MTSDTILTEYDTIDDALDDYLDAKNRGLTCQSFQDWFATNFPGEQPPSAKPELDGPDVPPVDFGDGPPTSRVPRKRPPHSPNGSNAKVLPKGRDKEPPQFAHA